MIPWPEPAACIQARDLIRAGKLVDAARLLAQAPGHRAVKLLALEVRQTLMQRARQAFQCEQYHAAWIDVRAAGLLGTFEGDEVELVEKISLQMRGLQHQRELQGRLQEFFQQGRWETAHELLAGISAEWAEKLRGQIQARQARFLKYLETAESLLLEQRWDEARPYLHKAQQMVPQHPKLEQLFNLVHQHSKQAHSDLTSVKMNMPPRCWCFGAHVLVVLGEDLLVGRAGDEGVTIPLLGRVARQHARLLRDGSVYRLLPCIKSGNLAHAVYVNGRLLGSGDTVILQPGDQIGFGTLQDSWRFDQPVADSRTAVLELAPDAQQAAGMSGDRYRRVILLADRCIISASRPAHIVWEDFPSGQLELRNTAQGMMWLADHLELTRYVGGEWIDQETPVAAEAGVWRVQASADECDILAGIMNRHPMIRSFLWQPLALNAVSR